MCLSSGSSAPCCISFPVGTAVAPRELTSGTSAVGDQVRTLTRAVLCAGDDVGFAAGEPALERDMSSIRETSSAARRRSAAVQAKPAAAPSILKRSDTMLVVIGLGIFAILLVLVTCL
jgi:hypothetical protein